MDHACISHDHKILIKGMLLKGELVVIAGLTLKVSTLIICQILTQTNFILCIIIAREIELIKLDMHYSTILI